MDGHTIPDVSAIREPATQRDNRDFQTGPAEEPVLHFRKSVRHCEGQIMINLRKYIPMQGDFIYTLQGLTGRCGVKRDGIFPDWDAESGLNLPWRRKLE